MAALRATIRNRPGATLVTYHDTIDISFVRNQGYASYQNIVINGFENYTPERVVIEHDPADSSLPGRTTISYYVFYYVQESAFYGYDLLAPNLVLYTPFYESNLRYTASRLSPQLNMGKQFE